MSHSSEERSVLAPTDEMENRGGKERTKALFRIIIEIQYNESLPRAKWLHERAVTNPSNYSSLANMSNQRIYDQASSSRPFLRLALNGVSFPVRHRSRRLLCGRIRDFQGQVEGPLTTDLLERRRERPLGLVSLSLNHRRDNKL